MYAEDRILVAIMNNLQDWDIVQSEHWYRVPVKKAPADVPYIDWVAFYFGAKFASDRWAIHYYAPVEGHELTSRQALFPNQANHPRAGNWYYKIMLGPLYHKLPPIVSRTWRRITFILTTGDRFEQATEIHDLYAAQSPLGQPFVSLKEETSIYL